ncbi:MAG: ACP S-malonyltransferase, partial [Ignavibacteria bacterium]|nr:ACP S-malonyltransferase [Ignavibacteria bacterium]
MSFEDGIRIVRLRGELMQRAGEENMGTMAAVVGLSPEAVDEICCETSSAGVVRPANFNSPGQIVISGSVSGVCKALEIAKQKGAKLVKELVVSGAFHSPLMESAKEGLKQALDQVSICDSNVPVYANVTGEAVNRGSDIRDSLLRQMTNPVRWEQTVKSMARDGASRFYEIGPGKVLQGLVRRTEPSVEVSGFDKYIDHKSHKHSV